MASASGDRSAVWAWIEQLAACLAADPDLVGAFERTPGKVARQLGIPDEAIGPVLAMLSRSAGAPQRPPVNGGARADPEPEPTAD